MKKIAASAILASLALSACTPPGDLTGNNRVSVGVAVGDSKSAETATRTVDKETGEVSWSITPGEGVTFTFMTRPGSDAVYLNGYRILKETVTTVDGEEVNDEYEPVQKMDLYLTSGFSCSERAALRSCDSTSTNLVPANGLPATHTIYLERGLGGLVRATEADVSQVTNIEFYGQSSTGKPVTVTASGVVSRGVLQGK